MRETNGLDLFIFNIKVWSKLIECLGRETILHSMVSLFIPETVFRMHNKMRRTKKSSWWRQLAHCLSLLPQLNTRCRVHSQTQSQTAFIYHTSPSPTHAVIKLYHTLSLLYMIYISRLLILPWTPTKLHWTIWILTYKLLSFFIYVIPGCRPLGILFYFICKIKKKSLRICSLTQGFILHGKIEYLPDILSPTNLPHILYSTPANWFLEWFPTYIKALALMPFIGMVTLDLVFSSKKSLYR